MNLELFNLRQLQDTKVFLTLCGSMPLDKALQVLEQEIKGRIKKLPDSEALDTINTVPSKACPSCDGLMREESKVNELIWHCLSCQYSEYIGVK